MIVKITTDSTDIKAILCDPAIYDTITDDNSPLAEDFEPPITDDYLYIGGYVDGQIIALMVYHKYLDGNKCHVQVLPKFRKEYAKEFGEQSLKFKGESPLYATVPSKYINVIRFANSNGFSVIKTLKNNHLKDGKFFDEYVLKYTCD